MYKLIAFEATNVIGFRHGLGRKHFSLDLSDIAGKRMIVILGDNASGKSTLLSLIHPTHYPSDGRNKFIIKDKEGMVYHKYYGSDSSVIETKVIYTPKKNGHTAKAYFKLTRDGKETEMNPTGNISSYNILLESFFGLTQEYVRFASYQDTTKGIVSMTDQERKLNVSTLIPNTKRLSEMYNTMNSRYKDLNSRLKALSQKILRYPDMEELEDEYKRACEEMKRMTAERDDIISKISLSEGRIRELTRGTNASDIMKECREATHNKNDSLNDMTRAKNIIDGCRLDANESDSKIRKLVKEYSDDITSITFLESEYESKIKNLNETISFIQNNLSMIDNQLESLNSNLYSINYQNIDELYKLKDELYSKLESCEYSSEYANLSYEICVELSSKMAECENHMVSLVDNYGELVSKHFVNVYEQGELYVNQIIDKLNNKISSLNSELSNIAISLSIVDKELGVMSAKLELADDRSIPDSCNVPECPFAQSVRMFKTLRNDYESKVGDRDEMTERCSDIASKISDYQFEIESLKRMVDVIYILNSNLVNLYDYLEVSVNDVVYEFGKHSKIHKVFNMKDVREKMRILSQKELYTRLIESDIPNVEKSIQMHKDAAKTIETIEKNQKLLEDSRKENQANLKSKKNELIECSEYLQAIKEAKSIIEKITEYQERFDKAKKSYLESSELEERLKDSIERIEKHATKIREYNKKLDTISRELSAVSRRREEKYLDLNQLHELSLEKVQIDFDFMIASLMRDIVYPGKNMWQRMIDIYMEDIRIIANNLLMFTFNGNLSLKKFDITDTKFTIPYTYNGEDGEDISYASSSQKTMISNSISMAVISKLLDKYGIITMDEVDKDLSPDNKEIFVKILEAQLDFGIQQCFIITHNPSYYLKSDAGYILFPGASPDEIDVDDYVEVTAKE